jgi:outer membrane protein insertion porin family
MIARRYIQKKSNLFNFFSPMQYLLFFVLFLNFNMLITGVSSASVLEGKIRAIEVEGLTRITKEELVGYICFQEGDNLDREALRAGIKRAFKKGIFLDIAAVAEPYNDGIRLKYIVKEIPIVRKIVIKGNREVSLKDIKKILLFREGEDFHGDLLVRATADLKRFLLRKGFPDADVRVLIENDLKDVDIHVMIEEGNPVIIETVKILPDLKNRLSVSAGDVLDLDKIEEDIGNLRKYYIKQKYIRPVVGPYEFDNGVLVIPVDPRLKQEVAFKGNNALSSKRLLNSVSFLKSEEVNTDLLREGISSIIKLYQQKGYYYVQVSGGIERDENNVRVVFFIYEGEKVILREIAFEGIGISEQAVKDIIPLREGKPFDKDLLAASRESITGFYNALGYFRANVVEVKEEFFNEGRDLKLLFTINQDQLIKIKRIDVRGNSLIGSDEIKNMLLIAEDDPYNEKDISDARYRVLSYYHKLGYANAEVEVGRLVEDDSAFVTFNITENTPFVFGRIIVNGNRKTKEKIIRREFAIKEGEPFQYEAIFKTRQRLYKLGIFDSISIEPIETADVGNCVDGTGESRVRDVLVRLEEGKPGAVEISLGYGDYERLRGSLDISYSNLGGYNRQIGFRTELSSVEERYMLSFTEPWLFNKPHLPLSVSLTKEKSRSIDIDTKDVKYKINRISFIAGVDKEFTQRLKGNLSYEYARVKTTDVEPGVILSKEDTGTVGISSISPSLFYDTRDNPFNPQSGSLKGIVLKLASKAFLSESEFIKAVLQSSWYFQLRRGLVFAFSLKGGIANGLGDSVELPLVERFFLGGRTTVRGYDHDELGPKGDDGNPTGGNVFALANSELRLSFRKGFGMVTFVDAGNVWQRITDVEAVLRYTAGLGVMYNTPVGPIRIDYGYKLNRKKGESAGELHFSLGHAF